MLTMPGPAVRCPFCRTPRVTVDLLGGGEYRVKVLHHPRCRTRWSDAARRHCDQHLLEWLDRTGTCFIPDYGFTPPRHRFAGVVA
jgi:hypothetical protein